MIVVVDYGMANVGSILNMLKRIGASAQKSADPDEIIKAEKLILPGVGSFDNGINNIEWLGLRDVLDYMVLQQNRPILGICLGMQLMTNSSEEGKCSGLGWVNAETVRLNFDGVPGKYRIPHMGWNEVYPVKLSKLFEGIEDQPRFYHVHSYHLACHEPDDVLAVTEYGYRLTTAIEKRNIIGTQFHPEKSHKYGMHILRNFVERY